MELKVLCLNHLCKHTTNVEKPGKGNCLSCIPHEDNKNCSEYSSIKIISIIVSTEQSD